MKRIKRLYLRYEKQIAFRPHIMQNGHVYVFPLFEKITFFRFEFLSVGDCFNISYIFDVKHISDEIVLYSLSCAPFFR